MWASSELWRRRCETPQQVEDAMRDAGIALRLAAYRPYMRVKRYPRKTFYVTGGERKIMVTARVIYAPEDNPTYARRFQRNYPTPFVS
jgi:hypothetical protein